MTIETIEGITRLTADEGKIITDGAGTVGRVIWLGQGRQAAEFHETDAAIEDAGRISQLEQVIDGILEVLA